MTTPSENFHQVFSQSCNIKINGSSYTPSYVRGSTFRQRPISGSTTLRPDGSRPPRAWNHYWGSIISPIASFETFRLSNGSTASGSVPYWNNNAYSILQYADAKWAAPGLGGVFPVSVRSAARTKFLNKLQDGKANWGQTMGEAKRTVDGLTDLAHRLLNGVNKLASYYRLEKRAVARVLSGKSPGRVPNYKGDLARAVKDIPNAWLEYQFGIKPLLRDIDDSAKAVDHLLFGEKHIPKMVIRAGHSADRNCVSAPQTAWSPGMANRLHFPVQEACHLSATYEIPVSSERRMQQLGLGNPFSVAWELTPWSWAADYGTDMGDWLNSLFAREGTKFMEGSETLYMKYGTDVGPAWVEVRPDSGYIFKKRGSGRGIVCTGGRISRSVLTGTPSPWFPTFRNRLGLNQMANLMAALSQMRK